MSCLFSLCLYTFSHLRRGRAHRRLCSSDVGLVARRPTFWSSRPAATSEETTHPASQGGEGPGLPLQGNAAAALRDAASRGRLEPFHRVQRPKHGLWRVTLLYWAALTAAVVKQARQGHVRCIGTQSIMLAPALTRRVVRTCWAQTARCSSSACYTGVSTGKPLCSARGRLPLARRRCGAVLRRLYLVGLSSSLQAAGPVARAEPAGAAQYLNAVRYWMASCPTTT